MIICMDCFKDKLQRPGLFFFPNTIFNFNKRGYFEDQNEYPGFFNLFFPKQYQIFRNVNYLKKMSWILEYFTQYIL